MKAKKLFFSILALVTVNIAIAQDIVITSPDIKFPEEVTITGLVKNEAGTPLANATVKTVFGDAYFTDGNGQFSFSLKKEKVIPQSIFISYDSLVTEVRSYHPVMANTDYMITLYKPVQCCCPQHHCDEIKHASLKMYFEENSIVLSEQTKKQLDSISGMAKECPSTIIRLTVYADYKKTLQRLADERLDALKKYLIEQDGISIDRINPGKTTTTSNANSVDIKLE
ncbi:hypothetical protein [Ferruginibacter albus]|uniref:hypothetical protein n=1 Tax=Ferruginibacter albus TaxID=2875540 RepID=UPI001CC74DFC|nr:hypothetical protein [Ferruginibacter albus]UAY52482.1 hypothetical protein K9M53_02040 [Ferruginibacter albus]